MTRQAAITNESCRVRLVDALREVVGPGKGMSYETASDLCGVEYDTFVAYALGRNLPKMPTLLRMFAVFGPAFANRVLAVAGLDGAARTESAAITDFALNADMSGMMASLGDALRDGRVDHRERKALLTEARHLMPALQDYIAQHDDGANNDVSSFVGKRSARRYPPAARGDA